MPSRCASSAAACAASCTATGRAARRSSGSWRRRRTSRSATVSSRRVSTAFTRQASSLRRSPSWIATPDRCSRASHAIRWPGSIARNSCWCSARAQHRFRRAPTCPPKATRRRRPGAGRGGASVELRTRFSSELAQRLSARGLPMRMLPNVAVLAPAAPEEILRPVKRWFIALTLFLALLANLAPLSGVAMVLRPDFLALVLLYWCIQEPRFVGVAIAWCVGLVMDVGDATLFGQHALAYAFLAYAGDYFRRRVLRFPLWQQAVQVAVLLGLCAGLVLLVRIVGGAPMPRWTYAVPPITGALLWPLVSVLLQW